MSDHTFPNSVAIQRTGKSCDCVDIVELAKPLALKACPQIGDENLRSLVKANSLVFPPIHVSKAREVLG